MSFNLTGTIHKIEEAVTISDKLTKRCFVLKDDMNEQYPQLILFDTTNDKCGMLDRFNVGDRVNVHFNIRGREHKEKFFNNLQAWKIE